MANNYTEFSCALNGLSEEELGWIDCYLDGTQEYIDDEEKTLFEEPPNRLARYLHDAGNDYIIGFDAKRQDEDDQYWFTDQGGNADLEALGELVSEFLANFRPNDVWSFTWAGICDKPRIGEFGGGAVVVTASEVFYMDAWEWARRKEKELRA